MGDKQPEIVFEDDAEGRGAGADASSKPSESTPRLPWQRFVREASPAEIRKRFAAEAGDVLSRHKQVSDAYCCLTLFDPHGSITGFEADRMYQALSEHNAARDRDVLLLIQSRGGNIEPAYQITKLCKLYAADRFVVAIPREAKSSATLVAIGADEIHMGPLSELGPIDPQIGGLPALGVKQALDTIAALAAKHPRSSDMFAQYLRMALTVEQIGYCERIGESAVQYAERLLGPKKGLPGSASNIARELVYEYKHHGFVIDSAEAAERLGGDLVKTDTPEIRFAEELYRLFDIVDLWLGPERRLVAEGLVGEEPMILTSAS